MKSRLFSVARAVAVVTYHEIIRDKVLYNIFLFGILLIGMTYAASQLTFIAPDRIILDFGFSAINLSCTMIAILNGSSMLAREFERRTIYVALARPITRFQFIIGKFFGLVAVLATNWLLLSIAELALIAFVGGRMSSTVFLGLAFLLLQSCVLGAIAIFFSSFVTTSIAVIIGVGIYLVGNNISAIEILLAKFPPGAARSILTAGSLLLPNLEFYNLGFNVTYSLPVKLSFVALSITYGLGIISLLLFLSGRLLQGKES